MSLFDAYVVVDWSANSKPKIRKDSIWIGSLTREPAARDRVTTENPQTRAEAQARVEALLAEHARAERCVLLGFDFPYGYPAGFASRLKTCANGAPKWRATWNLLATEVHDDPTNANNRFAVASKLNALCDMAEGPFWGCPKTQVRDGLSTKGHDWKASCLRQYRHTEQRLRAKGSLVQEVWKLWTRGSVGSQALLGIPRLAGLRHHAKFQSFSAVWPFETGFVRDPVGDRRPSILHAEIWPGIANIDSLKGRVPDDVQVETLARHFAVLDDNGELGTFFDRPGGLDDEFVDECVNEEGWILGA